MRQNVLGYIYVHRNERGEPVSAKPCLGPRRLKIVEPVPPSPTDATRVGNETALTRVYQLERLIFRVSEELPRHEIDRMMAMATQKIVNDINRKGAR